MAGRPKCPPKAKTWLSRRASIRNTLSRYATAIAKVLCRWQRIRQAPRRARSCKNSIVYRALNALFRRENPLQNLHDLKRVPAESHAELFRSGGIEADGAVLSA